MVHPDDATISIVGCDARSGGYGSRIYIPGGISIEVWIRGYLMANVMKWGEMLLGLGALFFVIKNATAFGNMVSAVVKNSVGLVTGVAGA
jgi:hypothetical protein